MGKRLDDARTLLKIPSRQFDYGVRRLSLDEALFAAGGYRSILGVLKHIGGWVHVYHSYAFDAEPLHFAHTSWPHGLKDTVETSQDYVDEVVVWIQQGLKNWDTSLKGLEDETLDEPRPLHMGGKMPLGQIVAWVASHVSYHTGELNMLLSIKREEAWEYTEEVEENHISTLGHGIRGDWMSDEHAAAHVQAMRQAHEARQRGG